MNHETFYRSIFYSAAIYNIAWGLTTVLFPNLMFELLGIEPLNYPFMMSGIGMMVGVYGYGYWVVARHIRQYPQLVVIGIMGKLLGAVGWSYHVYLGDIPAYSLWMNVFNDVIWLPLFVGYLFWVSQGNRQANLKSGEKV
ncbi:MAG: alkyl hydroperoxide reductase [Methylococcales bacterium]|jgi:small multidrug resistance pump|nr:alkyl hydroperoxide reductase [Methylococcales bacterium]MBT7444170.1 alkyl hydroperoxide reductase [Methylococcales bacterium]